MFHGIALLKIFQNPKETPMIESFLSAFSVCRLNLMIKPNKRNLHQIFFIPGTLFVCNTPSKKVRIRNIFGLYIPAFGLNTEIYRVSLCIQIGLRIGSVQRNFRTKLNLKGIKKCLQDRRLQWFGHLERMEE